MTSTPPGAPRSDHGRLARKFRIVSRGKREWEAAVDSVPELVFLTDPEDRVLRCNVAARDALGRPFDEILGQRLPGLLASRWECEVPSLADAAGGLDVPKENLSFEFTRFPTSSRSADLGFVYVFRDVTELRRLQEVASRVDMMNNLGHVLSCVRHEIGNPVNALKTALTVMAESLHDFSGERMLSYIHRCQEDVRRIQSLLERLRTFNLFEVSPSHRVDLRAFLREEVATLRHDLAGQGIELECTEPDGEEAVEVYCDPPALYQVLLGLIANATEAIAEIDRPGMIQITLEIRDRWAELAVSDNGPGIDPAIADQVILPLFTTKPEGTGLGLAIAHTMLGEMGATLEVGDDPILEGARITLRLRRDS